MASRKGIRQAIKPEEFIFINEETGEPWVDYRKPWKRALKKAKIPNRKGLVVTTFRPRRTDSRRTPRTPFCTRR